MSTNQRFTLILTAMILAFIVIVCLIGALAG